MAPPIPLEIPPRDPGAELQARLNRAPLEHAEALLDWLEVLQGLHDRGVFEFVRGALGAGGELTQMASEAAKSPESVRAIRNILILGKTLAAFDPAMLESFAKALPQATAQATAQNAAPRAQPVVPAETIPQQGCAPRDCRRQSAPRSMGKKPFARKLKRRFRREP